MKQITSQCIKDENLSFKFHDSCKFQIRVSDRKKAIDSVDFLPLSTRRGSPGWRRGHRRRREGPTLGQRWWPTPPGRRRRGSSGCKLWRSTTQVRRPPTPGWGRRSPPGVVRRPPSWRWAPGRSIPPPHRRYGSSQRRWPRSTFGRQWSAPCPTIISTKMQHTSQSVTAVRKNKK